MVSARIAHLVDRDPDVAGKSKRLWRLGDDTCVVDLVGTLSSYTHGREALYPRTAGLRLDFYERAAAALADEGLPVAYLERLDETRYLARYAPSPPFETICKNYAVGSTQRKYPGLFDEGSEFRRPIVKHDYRVAPEDQPIGEDYLRYLGIPVDEWRSLTVAVNRALRAWLAPNRLIDFCLVFGVGPDGAQVINSEISPDCMRLRSVDDDPLDKDLFRFGADEAQIVAAWTGLVSMLPERR